jgi:hypothetical protein
MILGGYTHFVSQDKRQKKLKVGISKNETAAQASNLFFEMATLHRGISFAYNVPANYSRKIDMAFM